MLPYLSKDPKRLAIIRYKYTYIYTFMVHSSIRIIVSSFFVTNTHRSTTINTSTFTRLVCGKVVTRRLFSKGVSMSATIAYDNEVVQHFAALIASTSDNQKSRLKDADPDESIIRAVDGGLKLLQDGSTVPFVCRYREDIISPLTVTQVHELYDIQTKYNSLSSLRKRCLEAIDSKSSMNTKDIDKLKLCVKLSISKSELDDIYAPFKPPAKGSLTERAAKAVPGLENYVTELWEKWDDKDTSNKVLGLLLSCSKINGISSYDALKYLLAAKISSSLLINDAVSHIASSSIIVETSKIASNDKNDSTNYSKYEVFFDWKNSLHKLRDHQVLAIQRGVKQKALKLSLRFADSDFVKRRIKGIIFNDIVGSDVSINKRIRTCIHDAVDDAFSRLINRRVTAFMWREKVNKAEKRGIQVFAENVKDALLVPPILNPCVVLAVDPGHSAGMKIAMLNQNGDLLHTEKSLSTLRYLQDRKYAAQELTGILKEMWKCQQLISNKRDPIRIALGNGHGSEDCRKYVEDVASRAGIAITITLVNEAGASVWSVTKSAMEEFPTVKPSEIASVSIGRRLINPMNEIVKIPPKSLGLGMYQHDLNEKKLEEKLHLATIDAVAFVGADVNTCSLAILENIPGINGRIAGEIILCRPFKSRSDLLKVKGLGPKAFENCAGFVRIHNADNILDEARIHPESYELSSWLMGQCRSNSFGEFANTLSSFDEKERTKLISKAAEMYSLSTVRVEAVISLLIETANGKDPRIVLADSKLCKSSNVTRCTPLPRHLVSNLRGLDEECPIRNILGIVRSVTDFGAFIDFGGGNDGLLHVSKFGKVYERDSLYVGKEIGVDIVHVEVRNKRISLVPTRFVTGYHDDDNSNTGNPLQPQSEKVTGMKRKRKSV